MRKAILFFIAAMITLPANGQQSVAEASAAARAKSSVKTLAPDAPTHDQVNTLLELLQVRKNMGVMMDGMKQAMKEGAEQTFRERIPNPTPKQLEALHGMIDDMVADMPLDQMLEAIVPIYQRHLTKSDIDEMIRFYSSPVGQKLLREQPEMLRESIQAGAEVQRKSMDQMMVKIRERTQRMEEERGKDETKK